MVVLRLGGAYADIDAECRQPLDSIIQPADTLLVGWDTEVGDATAAAATGLARQRLIANWFFVAAAGHPVLRELCDHIARKATSTFSTNSMRDTAERTGQGVWTDTMLRHALAHPVAKVGGVHHCSEAAPQSRSFASACTDAGLAAAQTQAWSDVMPIAAACCALACLCWPPLCPAARRPLEGAYPATGGLWRAASWRQHGSAPRHPRRGGPAPFHVQLSGRPPQAADAGTEAAAVVGQVGGVLRQAVLSLGHILCA